MPLTLIGGPTWHAWQARHSARTEEPSTATAPEREALWAVVEPFLRALDARDETAANRAIEAVEDHVATVERSDAAAGARLRALLERIEQAIEGRLNVA
jgi:hypothetical protein